LFLFAFLIAISCTTDGTAQNTNEWVASEISRSLPGQEDVSGKTYFSNKFGIKEGTFEASYRSIFDKRNKVSGKFLVAKFRYIYDDPIGDIEMSQINMSNTTVGDLCAFAKKQGVW
jgi:hypothetical protein